MGWSWGLRELFVQWRTHEAIQVEVAQTHVDASAVVGVVAEQTLALRVRLLSEAVVDRVHLTERADHPLALGQDAQHGRVG